MKVLNVPGLCEDIQSEVFSETRSVEDLEVVTIGEFFDIAAKLLPHEASFCSVLLSSVRTGASEDVTNQPLRVLDSETKNMLTKASVLIRTRALPSEPSGGNWMAWVSPPILPLSEPSPILAYQSEPPLMELEEPEPSFHCSYKGYEAGFPPLLPPTSSGSRRMRLYMIFDDPDSCVLARIVQIIMMVTIALSTVSFVLESMPSFRERPRECELLKVTGRPLTVEACEPKPNPMFWYLELVCIVIFTVDYLARLSMYHSLLPRGIVRRIEGTLRFMVKPLSVIDLLAIVPFYSECFLSIGSTGPMRILRLCRVLRLFKAVKRHPGMRMLKDVMIMSHQPLMMLFFFNGILMVIFASLLYFIEGQRYSVDPIFTLPRLDPVTNKTLEALFPTGVYVRRGLLSDEDQPSPVRTIPRACWWVLVTMATVGYGDIVPTSALGKFVGVICFYTGVIFFALPIGVIGSNFELMYTDSSMDRRESRYTSKFKSFKALRSNDQPVTWLPREYSWRKRVFLLFEDPSASRLGKVISICFTVIILTSTLSFVMDSMEWANVTPDTEKCKRELTIDACEPKPLRAFYILETICVSLFTVDLFLRVSLVHTVQPWEIGLSDITPEPVDRPIKTTMLYCVQWLNIIDFLAILPYYISLLAGGSAGASVLRVLRLVRVFRILKMPKLRACAEMFMDIIRDSLPGLALILMMMSMVCVLYSSLLHFAESSSYSVTDFVEKYPLGCYVRPTIDGFGVEVSPYRSILHTFWWFFATSTTVGYGDDVPTTTLGRIVGVCTLYTGIVLVGLSITIVSGYFNKYYPAWAAEFDVRPLEETEESVAEQVLAVAALVSE